MGEEIPSLLGAGLILIAIFWIGFLSIKIKFPNVVLYILLGVILVDIVHENELLHFAAEIGIVLLFFLLGLEFSIKRLGGIARKIWPAGLLDIFLNLFVVMGIVVWFDLDLLTAFLIGGITYATSSSITAKLLDDSGRMANTETEFILALLIFEDLISPIIVAVLIGIYGGDSFGTSDVFILMLKIIGLTLGAVLLGKTIFRRFEEFLEKIYDEDFRIALLVGIALSYGGLALYLGLSEVLGAFLAGIMLSEMKRIELVEHVVYPVKDLLLPTFFVYFGTSVELGEGVPMIGLLFTLLGWTLIAKVLVGIIGGRWYGLKKRTSLRAGLSLTARGEFSVVIAAIATGTIKIFGGIYIVLAAFLGMILFERAPAITNRIYGKPKKKKKSIQVPGNESV
ncbi:cation:proton antiporter [Bacillaceae bacterium S4-13-58]